MLVKYRKSTFDKNIVVRLLFQKKFLKLEKLFKQLTVIDMSYYYLNFVQVKIFCCVLAKSKSVYRVNLSHCSLDLCGIRNFCDFLSKNDSVRSLSLRYNQIDENKMKLFKDFFQKNKTLTKLNLFGNLLSCEGVKIISQYLLFNNTISYLNLSYNDIGSKGMKYFSKCLKVNKGITNLNLFGNSIRLKGVKYLSEGLRENITLTNLNLRFNLIGNRGMKWIGFSLGVKSSITNINLMSNGNLGKDEMKNLLETSAPNKVIVVKLKRNDPIITQELLYLNIHKAIDDNNVTFFREVFLSRKLNRNVKGILFEVIKGKNVMYSIIVQQRVNFLREIIYYFFNEDLNLWKSIVDVNYRIVDDIQKFSVMKNSWACKIIDNDRWDILGSKSFEKYYDVKIKVENF